MKCKSVTPHDDGAISVIDCFLRSCGFETKMLTFVSSDKSNAVVNLFANFDGRSAEGAPSLGFLGHSDVVPAGDGWDTDPFGAVQNDGYLVGRGIADMKGGIAAFCSAAANFVRKRGHDFSGAIKILITGDEEVGSPEGARSLINWCCENNQLPMDCIIGEPSSKIMLGDRIYVGHRGSLNVKAKSVGKQGHVAYPAGYINSLANVCKFVANILDYEWKYKDHRFPKTNAEPTLLFTTNYAANVVPDLSSVNINVRFGSDYSAEGLKRIFTEIAARFGVELEFELNGNAYYCYDQRLVSLLASAIESITGISPQFSAAGGTSDGRYMASHCNIIEFGVQDATIHQKNEKIKIDDLLNLERIYETFMDKYFFN
jgi:succinyl-diaminopimelate desuccinylase